MYRHPIDMTTFTTQDREDAERKPMNANEMADKLEMGCHDWADDAATMLRQQQAEIEALKKDNKELHAVAQRMAMAESDARKSLQWFKDAKERQSEPVAWMRTNKQWRKEISWVEKEGFDIPLYTHPAEHDLGIAEAIGFEKGYKASQKEPYNNAVGKTIEGGAELVSDSDIDVMKWITTVKTLTNDEILCLWDYWSGEILAIDILDFADKYRRAILNEEGIIEWHEEYCKKMNEEDAKKVGTYKSQNNNQIDTYRYKNLTDEEIDVIGIQALKDTASITWGQDAIYEFARAILRKAQEK